MNMTPRLYVFGNYDTGEIQSVWASCLAQATGRLPDDFVWHNYYIE
jgi:hypothetical protein